MALRNPHRHTLRRGQHEDIAGIIVHVTMNAVVGAITAQNAAKVNSILEKIRRVRTRKDTRSERPDLLVVGSRIGAMDEKVKLVPRTVDVFQNLDKPCFHATAIQSSQNMKDSHLSDFREPI